MKKAPRDQLVAKYGLLFRLPKIQYAILIFVLILVLLFPLKLLTLKNLLVATAHFVTVAISPFLDLLLIRKTGKDARIFTEKRIIYLASFSLSPFIILGTVSYLFLGASEKAVLVSTLDSFYFSSLRLLIFFPLIGEAHFCIALSLYPLLIIEPSLISLYSVNLIRLIIGGSIYALILALLMVLNLKKITQDITALRLFKAYIASWMLQDPSNLEKYLGELAERKSTTTFFLEFPLENREKALLIFPGAHSGPFRPVGGFNLPFELIKFSGGEYRFTAVFHAPSTHEQDLPSKEALREYLESLKNRRLIARGDTISRCVFLSEGDFSVSCLAIGEIFLLFLSNTVGIEDIPQEIFDELARALPPSLHGKIVVVDSHNTLGPPIGREKLKDLSRLAAKAIEHASREEQYRFKVGFTKKSLEVRDAGPAGLSAVIFRIGSEDYAIAVADSNNAIAGLRDFMRDVAKKLDVKLIDFCTTDTHFNTGFFKSKRGYYSLGEETPIDVIAQKLTEAIEEAKKNLFEGECLFLRSDTEALLLGPLALNKITEFVLESFRTTKLWISAIMPLYIAFPILLFLIL